MHCTLSPRLVEEIPLTLTHIDPRVWQRPFRPPHNWFEENLWLPFNMAQTLVRSTWQASRVKTYVSTILDRHQLLGLRQEML